VKRDEIRFRFTGKSGKQWMLRLHDRRIAKIIRACQELPGQDLLQYLDDNGEAQQITSNDVNEYLKTISGKDITAKDFRTWAGTVLAVMALTEMRSFDSAAQAKRNIRAAIETVAARLGNTPTICRKCYIHPDILTQYLGGDLMLSIQSEVESELREDLAGLRPEEAAVLAILRVRLGREVSRIKRASAKRRTPGRSRPRVAARRSMPASSAA
jgi:DNA topoisomerase-1